MGEGYCNICGTMGKIQKHHISYEPEILQDLCINCHKQIHKHGVGGVGNGEFNYLDGREEEFVMLCEGGAFNIEIAKIFGVNPTTISHWKQKLGISNIGEKIVEFEWIERENKKSALRVGSQGRIIIPQSVLAERGIREGDIVWVTVEKAEVK